jgi:hypothetical protein
MRLIGDLFLEGRGLLMLVTQCKRSCGRIAASLVISVLTASGIIGCGETQRISASSGTISAETVRIEGLTGKAAKAAVRAAIEPDGRPRGPRRQRAETP